MEVKIIRRFDEKGRLFIPADLMEYLEIEISTELAVCSGGDGKIILRKLENSEDCKIFAITRVDNQRRIKIPKEMQHKTKSVEIYVLNGNLILEEAH